MCCTGLQWQGVHSKDVSGEYRVDSQGEQCLASVHAYTSRISRPSLVERKPVRKPTKIKILFFSLYNWKIWTFYLMHKLIFAFI
jgi:hypothetical protein